VSRHLETSVTSVKGREERLAKLAPKTFPALLFMDRAQVAEHALLPGCATLGVEKGAGLAPPDVVKSTADREHGRGCGAARPADHGGGVMALPVFAV